MAIDVNYILQLCQYIQNKSQAGNTLSPPEYNTLLEAVNINYLTDNYKNYETDQDVMDSLSFLKTITYLTVNPTTGQAGKPNDYFHISSFDYSYIDYDKFGQPVVKTVPIPRLGDGLISVRLTDPILKPKKTKPISQLLGQTFQFYPKDLGTVKCTYLRYPITPVWNGIYNSATDEFIYDPTTSVQPEYPIVDTLNFVQYILAYIGINLQMNLIEGFANQMKQQQ